MSTAEIFEKVREILVKNLDVNSAYVEMDTSIRELMPDSSELLDILLDLEEEFDVDITDEDFEEIDTVSDAVEYIKNEML